jgi:hypothetical protein
MRTSTGFEGRLLAGLVGALLCVTLSAGDAGAQSLGLKGGFNLSNLVGEDAQGESTVGLNAGGSFALISVGPVSIGPEIFYAQKGTKLTQLASPGGGASSTSTFNLAYVEVPVLVTVDLMDLEDSWFQPFVHAGPVFGWNLDCRLDLSDREADPEETCASLLGGDIESTLRDYERGITAGGGMHVTPDPQFGALTLDVRFTRGLNDVIERSSGSNLKIRNRTFTAMVGYSIGL